MDHICRSLLIYKQIINPMKIFLAVLLMVVIAEGSVCVQPQRTFYMSFSSLSKRDTLANLFDEMSQNMTSYNSNYTDSKLQANFRISNLKPHPFYNDHHQKDTYIDKLTANVSLGVITVSSFFNYSVSYADSNKSGQIRIRGFLDPGYFTKKLTMTVGYLEWVPDQVPALSFSQDFHIESASPNITQDERRIFGQMVNNQAGAVRIRDQTENQMNALFIPLLQQHLNHEDLISSNNITYKYNNITLQFSNFAKTFGLSNGATKGLSVFLLFGLESSTENCTKLPSDFDEDQYGGVQELYTFGVVRSMIKQALSKGLFDVTVDKNWQTSGFQFYMGDLGNSVPYANYAPANDPFKVICKFNQSRSQKQLSIKKYDEHQIYVAVPESCTVNYNGTNILALDFDVDIQVKLVGEEESIRVVVQDVGIFGLKYSSLDQRYQIADEYIARYSITEVLKGLKGKTTFGHDFPIIRRRYPVVRVLDDSLIMFDPSEV